MKLDKQFLFVFFVGCVFCALGFNLASRQLIDWGLFTVGLALVAAALVSYAAKLRALSGVFAWVSIKAQTDGQK